MKEKIPFTIEEANIADMTEDFLACLEELAPVGITTEQAKDILVRRSFFWGFTYVAKVCPTFDAKVGARVVGTATLWAEPKFIHGGSWAGRIEDVAVHKDWQGKGVGQALIRKCLDTAWQSKFYKVVLESSEETSSFYTRQEFDRLGYALRVSMAHYNPSFAQEAP